ncbi:MAG: hypothetical protein JWN98_1131 [Abditibacteriota bacterium]|nr:hypothetical protein [Abditibacteriota bacterium]
MSALSAPPSVVSSSTTPHPVVFDLRLVLAIVGTLVFWASAFPAIRLAVRHIEPGHLALWRFLTASVVLAIWARVTRMPMPSRADWPQLSLSGFLSITVYHAALNYGQVSVPSGAASFLINTAPVWTALLAAYFLRERRPWTTWLGISISFCGVLVLSSKPVPGTSDLGLPHFEPAALLILLSALSASISLILNKNLLNRLNALQITCWSVWSGTAFLLVFAPGLLADLQSAPRSATLSGLYLGIFPGALAYVLWTSVLSRLPATQTASFLYLVPPLATTMAWLWLGETLAPRALMGGALALIGVALVSLRKPRTPDSVAAAEEAIPLK